MAPFTVMDCTLLTRMSGLPPAYNLRELRDRVTICSEDVLYHHFSETWLRPRFDDPDYRNDFAVWAKTALGDRVLAERLAIIDPNEFESLEQLRLYVCEVFEERLGELQPWVPTSRPGSELFLSQATTVVFDTGQIVETPSELLPTVERMTSGSIYFHFLEARRRPPIQVDDFSVWLGKYSPEYDDIIQSLREIDFYFRTLPEIRSEIVRVLATIGGGRL